MQADAAESRPKDAERPCPACGKPVEPLRARRVILLEDGFRYLCDETCAERFRGGVRDFEAARSLPSVSSRPPRARSLAVKTPRSQRVPAVDRSAAHRAISAPREPMPWVGLGASVAALALGAFASAPVLAILSLCCIVVASTVALVRGWPSRREVGWIAWAMPASGATLAGVAALLARGGEMDVRLGLVGAAIASGTVVVRAWLDAQSIEPVKKVLAELAAKMPTTVRISRSGSDASTEVEWDVAPATRARTGHEVVAIEGDVIGVDGVVQAGEAQVFLHPSARAPAKRVPGDAVLAGARVADGQLRVLATRVGPERALVRPAAFGDAGAAEAASLTMLAARVWRWGGLAALVVALVTASLWSVTGPGIYAVLAAVAAVMLAAPLVAMRRASEAPYVAAAATAAERGIAFANARAVDRAGRAAVGVLCAHGTITEGEPEVVEIHSVDGSDIDGLMASVAGAHAAIEPRPLGQAILRFCERRRIPVAPVRRATFLPGRGVTALCEQGAELVVGNRALLLAEGVSVAVGDADAARAEARGQTVLFVGFEGRVRALILLRDEDRLGARAAVQRLIDLGIEVVVISGDHRGTVEALAKTIDITHVRAELLPEERGAEVKRLSETGGVVAAIGRARYDEAALGAAQVPVVLGAAGAPEGERGIALTGEDIRDAAAALWLARAARQAAWRGAVVAGLGGAALVFLAAIGFAAPVLVALVALGIDAYVLPSAGRLLRRIELRLPARG
ncbi:MAG: HAD family hydrolase [Sandaracinaceae bacterium]